MGTLYTKPTIDFYKGTSFRERGDWSKGSHYFRDEYNVDFVTVDGCLLECTKSHYSTDDNKPIITLDHGDPTLVSNENWKLILKRSPQIKVLSQEEWSTTTPQSNYLYYIYEDSIVNDNENNVN